MYRLWLYSVRFLRRLSGYSVVGMSTYALDLAIIAVLLKMGTPEMAAICIGYIIGVSTNYALCHRLVYRGTERTFWSGYAIFMCLALIGMGIILVLVHFFMSITDWNIFIVRTLVAMIVGFFGFLINTFFNFRLL